MRYISFDTCYLRSIGFNFDNFFFNKLKKVLVDKNTKIVLSSIVDREIKVEYIKYLNSIIPEYNKSLKRIKYLVKAGIIKGEIVKDDYLEKALDEYEKFKRIFNIEIIDLGKADAEYIFREYFDSRGAFGSKDKKNEFPDAVAIDSLLNYCGDNELVVISNDEDWVREFKYRGLQIIDNDCVLNNNESKLFKNDSRLLSYLLLVSGVIDNSDCLEFLRKDRTLESIVSTEMEMFLEDVRYPYDDAEVFNSQYIGGDIIDCFVIDKDETTRTVNINVFYSIEYYIESSFEDYDEGIWDSEDKTYAWVPHYVRSYNMKDKISFIISANYDYNNAQIILSNITIDQSTFDYDISDSTDAEEGYLDDPNAEYADALENYYNH